VRTATGRSRRSVRFTATALLPVNRDPVTILPPAGGVLRFSACSTQNELHSSASAPTAAPPTRSPPPTDG
jgi:hypothetical protein